MGRSLWFGGDRDGGTRRGHMSYILSQKVPRYLGRYRYLEIATRNRPALIIIHSYRTQYYVLDKSLVPNFTKSYTRVKPSGEAILRQAD